MMTTTRHEATGATSASRLLVRGGRVIDPSCGRDGLFDLLVEDGRIAAALDDQARRIAELEAELEAERAAKSAAPAKGRAKSTK